MVLLSRNKTVPYLPVFVYGTLREGMSNHRLLQGRYTKKSKAILRGYALWNINMAFPATSVSDDLELQEVVGELYYIDYEQYGRVMYNLDFLESEGLMYKREVLGVVLEDGSTVHAWVYVWMDTNSLADFKKLRDGDWVEYSTKRKPSQTKNATKSNKVSKTQSRRNARAERRNQNFCVVGKQKNKQWFWWD